MQNIEQILSEFGIEVPADKKANLLKKVAENYKTIAEHEKATGRLETDRDNWKTRAETAEGTLKNFEGVDLETMKNELSNWKAKAENAEREYNQKLDERDLRDKVSERMSKLNIREDMRDFIFDEIMKTGVKLNTARDLIGFDEGLKTVQSKRPSAFVDEKQQQLEQNRATITIPSSTGGTGRTMTREQILSIKDGVARQRAIAENIGLFKQQ